MIKKIFLGLLFASLVFAAKTVAFGFGEESFENSHPDQIIVKFKPHVPSFDVDRLNQKFSSKISQKLLLDQTFTIKIPEKQQQRFLKLFSSSPLVEYAEPDFLAKALEIPNDPYFEKQWGMTKIQAPEAWSNFSAHGDPYIKIAILDTGIDKDHPDLASKVDQWVNFTSSKTLDDLYGHGTHVAGIAAALTNNGLGIAGLGWETHLLSVKVLDDKGVGSHSSIANGIKWAADNGAKVINLSLGGPQRSTTLENAIKYAWGKGVVFVCAAGNSGNKSPTYPAYYSNCIATAATDQDDKKASWSSYGTWVDVAAPGVDIFSTFPNHNYKIGKNLEYDYGSGTSMATPHVAGLAALLFGSDSTLSNSDIRDLIEENADKISGTGKYWKYGRINTYQSILGLGSLMIPVVTPTPTSTPTPEPTVEVIPTLTTTPTATPTLTPTPTVVPTATPTPVPWWCQRWPRFCD